MRPRRHLVSRRTTLTSTSGPNCMSFDAGGLILVAVPELERWLAESAALTLGDLSTQLRGANQRARRELPESMSPSWFKRLFWIDCAQNQEINCAEVNVAEGFIHIPSIRVSSGSMRPRKVARSAVRMQTRRRRSGLAALAPSRMTEHVIHNQDGVIGERNSYGNDPAGRPG